MAKKQALGRGLGALLSVDLEEGKDVVESTLEKGKEKGKEKSSSASAEIALEKIEVNPYQPRIEFVEKDLEELTASIKELGIIQPITVRKSKKGFQIISGERRFRASKSLGLKTIPAFVKEASDQEMIEMAVVENIQRADLNPIEIARGYQRLIDDCDLSQEDVAKRVGKNRSTVSNSLRLLGLASEVQEALKGGKISAGHARVLVTLDQDRQVDILNRIIRRGLSVRDTEALGKVFTQTSKKKSQSKVTASEQRDQLELESRIDKMRTSLATQVRINHKKKGGVIEIEYFDSEDLDRVVDLIVK